MEDQEKLEYVSCTSPRWHFAKDAPVFEARRAVASLTRDMVHPARGDESPAVEDVLPYIGAVRRIAQALEVVLEDLVAEARDVGATWRQIGEELGTGNTNAQKRFGKGIDSVRRQDLADEHFGSLGVWLASYYTEFQAELSAEGHSEGTSHEPAGLFDAAGHLRHFVYQFASIHKQFERNIRLTIEQLPGCKASSGATASLTAKAREEIQAGHDRLKKTLSELATSGALGRVGELAAPVWDLHDCHDYSPGLYLSYGYFQALLADRYIGWCRSALNTDIERIDILFEGVRFHLGNATWALVRPECSVVHQAVIEHLKRRP